MLRILKVLFSVIRTFRSLIVVLLLAGSLLLNVATVTSTAVFTAVSGTVAAVSGVSTFLARSTAQRTAQKQAVRRTTQNVTRRVARGAARNTASAAGEAIPIAGIAVITAALAWEIRDACATARDMAVLEGMVDDPNADPEALANAFSCADLIPEAESLPTSQDLLDAVRSAPSDVWTQVRQFYDSLPESPDTAVE
ncbi:MAG: hypothetical protein AAGF71_02050 [Pseudomonadota bacterium]